MHKRTQQRLMVGIFGAVLLLLLVPYFVVPSQDSSPIERRDLAQKPDFPTTLSGVKDYFTGWDKYLLDQIPFRDTWTKAFFFTQVRVLGKIRVNHVTISHDGNLFWASGSPVSSRTELDKTIDEAVDLATALQEQMSTYGGRALFVGTPDKSSFYREDYPAYIHYSPLRNAAERDFLSALANRHVDSIDLWPLMDSHRDDQLYYKTDHHWTFAGAYLAYTAIMQNLGMPALQPTDLDCIELPNHFQGSMNRSLRDVVPTDERFTIGVVKNQVPYDLATSPDGTPETDRYYMLPESSSAHVSYGGVYRYSEEAEVIVDTHRDDLPDLLLVGDSFKAVLEPLLFESFNVTRVLDMRHDQAMSLFAYVDKYRPDYLVFMLSGPQFIVKPWNTYDKATPPTVPQQ
jgi:hypothetical protein